MKQSKRIVRWLSESLFRFSIATSIFIISAVLIFGDGNTVKQTLVDTNAYERFTKSAVEANSNQDNGLPFEDPSLQAIVYESFSDDYLQLQTEGAIDGLYAWLEGKSDNPKILLDFRVAEQDLIAGLKRYATNRFASLPPCTTQPTTVDPFTTPCVPSGATQDQITLAIDQAAEQERLLPQSVITEEDILPDETGQSIFERFSYAPIVFQLFVILAYVLPVIALLCAIGIILLRSSRRKGIQRVGGGLLSVGIGVVVLTFLYGVLVPNQAQKFQEDIGGQSTSSMQGLTDDISSVISAKFQSNLINISLYVAAAGLVIVALERISRPKPATNILKRSGLVSSHESAKPSSTPKSARYLNNPLQSSENIGRKRTKKRNRKAKQGIRRLE